MDEAQYFKIVEDAARLRHENPDFARWAEGHGAVQHTDLTQVRIGALWRRLKREGTNGDGFGLLEVLTALDRVTNVGMWLVVHQTYAKNVYVDGRPLAPADFKARPDGHTGGSLNMVPGYAGYLAANVIDGHTRAWLMGQGHCVAAVDSLNLLVGNMSPAHTARYDLSDDGLTRYARDFYSYRLREDGRQDSPLGSHVNMHSAGGIAEGGYLGFAELQYVHIPLPGDRLVAFLSDGAFEEQRGGDWAARWWRAHDSGLVAPIMIANGRRIDQRTTMSQQGGVTWLQEHLRLNGFDPLIFDGRDPAAFAWAILEMEQRLLGEVERIKAGVADYPARLPYGIAVAPKGAGFPGEGSNAAHNLPLASNPRHDSASQDLFNEGAKRLWVPMPELQEAVSVLTGHARSQRPRERDNSVVTRECALSGHPPLPVHEVRVESRDQSDTWTRSSPMEAVDLAFEAIVKANPHLRPRVGNPDEMRSNRLTRTLEHLRFRVTDPEPNTPEALDGSVITALNEEAIVAAALANKGGVNLAHTYEAFGPKMQGAIRQEIIFASQVREYGKVPGWLSVPIILTSHTWENGKNEQSHQDPALAESLLAEPFDASRVLFPADFNCASAIMDAVYRTHGQIWTVVIPKAETLPNLFTPEEAKQMVESGVAPVPWAGLDRGAASLTITAVGAYQLEVVLQASRRLAQRGIPHGVSYMLEPGRCRPARTGGEAEFAVGQHTRDAAFPPTASHRLFVTHTHPEPILGLLGPLHTGARTSALGYTNRGGTLNTPGMLFVNRCSWAHCVQEVARLLSIPVGDLLDSAEIEALSGIRSPHGIIIPEVSH